MEKLIILAPFLFFASIFLLDYGKKRYLRKSKRIDYHVHFLYGIINYAALWHTWTAAKHKIVKQFLTTKTK